MLTASPLLLSFSLTIDSNSSKSNPRFRFQFANSYLMDFQSLNRRELQSLCKLNNIPANITNIAMADALKSLETVEGIEEFLNPSRSETAGSSIESPEKIEVTSPRVPRTSCRTSTRQKEKKTEVTRTTRRGVRRQLAGEVDQFLKTPLVSSTRKKAMATSSMRNVASQLNECEEVAKNECLVDHEIKCIPNMPAALVTYSRRKGITTSTRQDTVKKETTVQRVYSTRRSARLTEKISAEPSVMGRERSDPVKIGSFLDEVSVTSEEDLGNSIQVPGKTVGSGSDSMETSHELNTSESIEVYVGEGSVDQYDVVVSKAKVEDICNAFEKLDVLVMEGDAQHLMVEKAVNMDATFESEVEKVDCCGELNILKVKSDEISDQHENVDLEEKLNVGENFVLNEDDNSKKGGEVDNPFEDVDLQEKLNVAEEKFDLNEVDNAKAIPEDSFKRFVPKEHSDSKVGNAKASLLSGADGIDADAMPFDRESPSDPSRSRHEDMFCAVSERKNEIPECNRSLNMMGDVIHFDTENPSEPSKLGNLDNQSFAEEKTADGIEENISGNTVDMVLVGIANPNEQEPSMDFEAPAEEAQESLIEETVVDVTATIYGEPVLNCEQLNHKAKQTIADAGKVTQESVIDVSLIKKENQIPTSASDIIDHPTHLTPMKKETSRNGLTSISGMAQVSDIKENCGRKLQLVIDEEKKSSNEKAGDEKPKSLNETSMRQLKKQLKALSIKNNMNTNGDEKVAEARPALQALCDNQLATVN